MRNRLLRAHSFFVAPVLASLALAVTGCGGGATHAQIPKTSVATAPQLSSVPFRQSSSCQAATETFTSAGLRVATNIDYENVSQGGLCLDVFRPAGTGSHPAVMLLHGEGVVPPNDLDGRDSLRHLAIELAEHGLVAVDVDWPPYPTYHFPIGVRGVDSALSYVESHSSAFDVARGHIGLLGTSAGGVVAGYVATQHIPYLKAVVTWSGAFDATGPLATAQRLHKIFGSTSPSLLEKYSAVRHVTSDTPAFAMFNSTNELIPLSQPQAMAAALSAAGVPHELIVYPGTAHATHYASQAIGPTIQWFRKYLT